MPPPKQPKQTRFPPIISNLENGETVHQRFVLAIGRAGPSQSFDGYLSVKTASGGFPEQTFPVTDSYFKAMIHLEPGANQLTITFHPPQDLIDSDGLEEASKRLTVTYLPLIQVPPLHLAILVASDSPLMMDCPPEKLASPGHSDLNACVKKLRMAAYMWQAFTAEEMRSRGLGRRAFRLDEQWMEDTLSIQDEQPTKRATAKIHIVRTTRTTAEIRDKDRAQQNPDGTMTGDIYSIFLDALRDYGAPFDVYEDDDYEPVVAGHILDSHWSAQDGLILGHAALGGNGGPFGKVHLGMFGSHTTWAWPRFVEEIVPCLLDSTRVTGKSNVANDAKQCGTFWETCCIGQGAALHEAGHAMGCPHRSSGIMRRGYVEWNRSFLSKESYCDRTKSPGKRPITGPTKNHWHIADLINFRYHRMFWQPGDKPMNPEERRAALVVHATSDSIQASSRAGIVVIEYIAEGSPEPVYDEFLGDPLPSICLYKGDLINRFKKTEKLTAKILAFNGQARYIANVWEYMNSTTVRIPHCDLVLSKNSVLSGFEDAGKVWKWAALLTKVATESDVPKIISAVEIVLYKGSWFDGAEILFPDGSILACGPRFNSDGDPHKFGGGRFSIKLNPDEKIVKVRVLAASDRIDGVTVHTNEGKSGGKLTFEDEKTVQPETLEPSDGDEVIGFYGHNQLDNQYCQTLEFGIITAPGGTVLPLEAYSLKALTNTDGVASLQESNEHGSDIDYDLCK